MAAKAKPKKKEPKQKKPRAAAVVNKIFNNDDPEAKALFLQHLPKIRDLKAKVATATSNLRNAYKSAKAQGAFEKGDFDFAFELETAEQEAKARAKIARNLQIARYVGSDMGSQLDLFLEPDRTPAVDRAYEEGQRASMQNEKAAPIYAPDTDQHGAYMKGFHEHQASLGKGIKPLHPAVAEDVKKTAAAKAKVNKQKAKDAAEFEAEAVKEVKTATENGALSGVPMSRSEFLKQQREKAGAA